MVEWKKLGDFASVQKTKNKKHITENAYSITQAGLVPTKSFFKEKTHVTSADTSGYYIVQKDWFVYSPSRIDVGSISYLKDEGPVIVSPIDVVFSIDKNKCLPSYLLSYFFTYDGKKEILRNREGVEGMGRRNLPFEAIKNMPIPLPSLSEQERIVGILDTFTSSIENLKAQISLRRKQYEHYRDKLLDLEGKPGVEMKTLGEVCNFIRGPFGGALKKEIFVNEGYAIYEQQHAIYGEWSFRYFIDEKKFSEMKRFEVKPGDILMSCSGTMGKTSIVPSNCIKGIINQALLKLTTRDILDNKFLKKYMDSQWFQDGLKKQVAGGAIQNVASVSILKDLIIPLPSLEEQSRIVSILDEFEASIKNLEAQFEAREKQYEYYREKLLTFERE